MGDRLTVEKIAELRQAFNFYDKDGSGSISVQELGAVMRICGQEPTPEKLHEMISSFDMNTNGELEFSEFLVMMSIYARDASLDEETRIAFRVFDQDGNGLISPTELKSVLTGLGDEVSDQDVADMIRVADMDGDGKLNYQEFTKMMRMKDDSSKAN